MGIVCDDIYEKAEKVARKVLDDLYKPEYEKMELVEKLAYAPRFQRWKELGILPGGAKGRSIPRSGKMFYKPEFRSG